MENISSGDQLYNDQQLIAQSAVAEMDESPEKDSYLSDDPALERKVVNAEPFSNPFKHPIKAGIWLVSRLFGLVSLVLFLAIISAIPIINFIALGYFLEVEGKIIRTGKIRRGLPLVTLAPRIASIVMGIWIFLLPLRLIADMAYDAELINPAGSQVLFLSRLNFVLSVLVCVHLCFALARGGSLSCFFRPIKNVRWLLSRIKEKDYWTTASSKIREVTSHLKIKYYFLLGLKGFLGAALWLFPPTFLLVIADKSKPGSVLITFIGGILLAIALAYVPFLQAKLAAENRLSAILELRSIRKLFLKAPIAWTLAILVTYLLSLPLYLFKTIMLPRDAVWFITIIFVITIYPTRVISGWAYSRAIRKEKIAWFGYRWGSRLLISVILVPYVFILFFTPWIVAHGRVGLFEHHIFLLPMPF
jgi:hypothetical protein